MTQKLKIGFVALCDSAALIIAHERGFFAEEGLDVDLIREPSWANIRDKIAFGALDAAHMLAPMLIETTMGVGNVKMPLMTAIALNSGGGSITSIKSMPAGRPSYAMVYPFSAHHYALRQYVAENGLDAELVVVPPAQMIAALSKGQIQGFCVGAPWGLLAQSLGQAVTVSRMPARMEKVLGVRPDWHSANGETHAGLLRAVRRASQWVSRMENHAETAGILAGPDYLNVPADVIAGGLTEIDFTTNRPSLDDARWYVDRMLEYGQATPSDRDGCDLQQIFRMDLFDEVIF